MIPINATSFISVPSAPLVATTAGATVIPPRFIAESGVRAVTPANIPLAVVANEGRGIEQPTARALTFSTNISSTTQAPAPAPSPVAAPASFIGNTSFLAQLMSQTSEVSGNSPLAAANRAYRNVSDQNRRSAFETDAGDTPTTYTLPRRAKLFNTTEDSSLTVIA